MEKRQLIIIACAVLAVVLIVFAWIGLAKQNEKTFSDDYKKPSTQSTDIAQDTTETQNSDIKFEVDENGNLVTPETNSDSGNTGNSNTGNSNSGSNNTGSNTGSGNTSSNAGSGNTSSNAESGNAGNNTDATEATQPKENKQKFTFSDFWK